MALLASDKAGPRSTQPVKTALFFDLGLSVGHYFEPWERKFSLYAGGLYVSIYSSEQWKKDYISCVCRRPSRWDQSPPQCVHGHQLVPQVQLMKMR